MAQQALSILESGMRAQFDSLDRAYNRPGNAQLEVIGVKRVALDGNDNRIQAREPLSCGESWFGAREGSRQEDIAPLAMNFLESAIHNQPGLFAEFKNFKVVVWLSNVLRCEPTFERYIHVLRTLWEKNIAECGELKRRLKTAEDEIGALRDNVNRRIDFHLPPEHQPEGLNWEDIERYTPPNLTIICRDGEKVATLRAIVKSTPGFATRALNDELNLETFSREIVLCALDVIKKGGFASNEFGMKDLVDLYKLASMFGHPRLIEHTANKLLQVMERNAGADLVKFVTSLENYIELFEPNQKIDRQFRNILLDYLAYHLGAILASENEENKTLESSYIAREESVQFGVDVKKSLVRKIPVDLFYDLLDHEYPKVANEDKMLAALISWALNQLGKPADIYATGLKGYPMLLSCIRRESLSVDAKLVFDGMCQDSKYPQTAEQREAFEQAQARGPRIGLQPHAEVASVAPSIDVTPPTGTPRSGTPAPEDVAAGAATPSSRVSSEPTRDQGSAGPPAARDEVRRPSDHSDGASDRSGSTVYLNTSAT